MTHPLFFNEAYYQNIRHNQVDWAALAQNWIRLRPEVPPHAQVFPPRPPAPLPPQQQWPNAVSRASRSLLGPGPSMSPMMTMSGPPPQQFQANSFTGSFEPPQANLWRQPAPRQSVEFGGFPVVRPPQPLCSLPPMQPPQRAPPPPPPPPPPPQAVPIALGAPPPPPLFAGVDISQASRNGEEKVPPWIRSGKAIDESNTDEQAAFVQLGAEQRKRLPAWIREGLERMEREKREREEKERKEREAMQRIELSPVRERTDGKSKFESDSESEPEQDDKPQRHSSSRSPTPLADYTLPPSPESFRRDANMLLKQWMTELLLGVCDNLINKECSQTFQKAQRRGGDDDSDNASSGGEDSDEEKSTVKKSRWDDSESSGSVGVFKTPAVPSSHRKSESNFAETSGTSNGKERTSRRHFEETPSEEKSERESRRRQSSDKSPKRERRRSRDRSPRDDRHGRRRHSRSPERHRSERRRRRSRSRSPRRAAR